MNTICIYVFNLLLHIFDKKNLFFLSFLNPLSILLTYHSLIVSRYPIHLLMFNAKFEINISTDIHDICLFENLFIIFGHNYLFFGNWRLLNTL